MLNKIEHIGIAVHDLEIASKTYEILTGKPSYKREVVESEGVLTEFFKVGDSKIELLAATDMNSVIAKFIAKKGEAIHHIAFDVDDIYLEMKRLQDEGFILINNEPKKGADNKLICFVNPKSANGVLIELCQEIKS